LKLHAAKSCFPGDVHVRPSLASFIEKNTALHKAVRGKEWANIASNYNGPSYKEFSYDSKLEQAYNEIKKKGTA